MTNLGCTRIISYICSVSILHHTHKSNQYTARELPLEDVGEWSVQWLTNEIRVWVNAFFSLWIIKLKIIFVFIFLWSASGFLSCTMASNLPFTYLICQVVSINLLCHLWYLVRCVYNLNRGRVVYLILFVFQGPNTLFRGWVWTLMWPITVWGLLILGWSLDFQSRSPNWFKFVF